MSKVLINWALISTTWCLVLLHCEQSVNSLCTLHHYLVISAVTLGAIIPEHKIPPASWHCRRRARAGPGSGRAVSPCGGAGRGPGESCAPSPPGL